MFNIGPLELIVVLIIALIVLGPQRLPEVARSVGRGLREFKGALDTDGDDEDERAPVASPQAAAIDVAPAAAAVPPAAPSVPQATPPPPADQA